ncbi:MAG: polysaccharide deacetylase family protein [Polyangiaceae bacterium]
MARRRVASGVALLGLALSCAGSDGSNEFSPVAVGLQPDETIIELQLRGADMKGKTLHLTFDDGPGLRTEELAAYLKGLGVPATFFINGLNVPGRETTLSAIVRDGFHTLGNHGQNHTLLTRALSPDDSTNEVRLTNDIIRKYQPRGPFYFRPPFSAMTSALYTHLFSDASLSLVGPIHWDIGTTLSAESGSDWLCWSSGLSPDECASRYLAEITKKKSGIVLLHDSRSKTVDLVKVLVPKLLAGGYRFVPLAEVPVVKRALTEGMPIPVKGQCFSGTTFSVVATTGCVQSSADQKWYECRKNEWTAFTGKLDDCATTAPLPSGFGQ